MIGERGENTFIKVCLPLDESETALASEKDEPCSTKAKYVEKEKQKNEDYIKKIKSNNFFKKSKKPEMVKLLPGEQMKFKLDSGDKSGLASQGIKYDAGTMNPPAIINNNQAGFPQMNFQNRNQMNFPNQFMMPPSNNLASNNPSPAMMQLMSNNLNPNDKQNNMINNFIPDASSPNFNASNSVPNSYSFKQQQVQPNSQQQGSQGFSNINQQGFQDPRMMQYANGQQQMGFTQFLQPQQQPNQLPLFTQGNQAPVDQLTELKNQISMLTQQLNQRNQQIDELMKKNQQPQFLTQGDKAFFSKPHL